MLVVLDRSVRASTLAVVPQTSFSSNPSTKYENFGEDINYGNGNASDVVGTFGLSTYVGLKGPYTFSQTNISLTPPNSTTYPGIAVVCPDFVGNHNVVNFGAYGTASNQIPGPTIDGAPPCYLNAYDNPNQLPFTLTFPGNGATMIGGDFIMADSVVSSSDEIVITAYSGANGTGTILGSESIQACTVSNWPNNFLGVESNGLPIGSINVDCQAAGVISNIEVGVANLMFVPVPEPNTFVLLGVSAIGLRDVPVIVKTDSGLLMV